MNKVNTELAEKPQMDNFDRSIGGLTGLPDVLHSKPSTIQVVPAFGIGATMYTVQTFRQKEVGDTIFLQQLSKDGAIRIILPAKVADTIARQREQLSKRSRSKAMKASMEDRMANGWKPNFAKQN